MNCGVLGDLLQVANAFGDLRHYEHTECGIVVSHFDGEDIQHEGYERSEAAPWNRNQSDELEERWRQENDERQFYEPPDEDVPDFSTYPGDEWEDGWEEADDYLPAFGDGYEEDFGDDDDFLEDDDEEQPYEEDYCDVCGGPCHFGRAEDEDS